MWMLWVSAAFGLEGFDPVKDSAGCAISMRPEEHELGAAMRAECAWPEVDSSHLVDLLSQYDRYTEYVFAIDVARIERHDDAGRALVYQRQEMWGISDRELLLWMWAEPVPGGTRFAWTTASEEPLELQPGAIRVPLNQGYWQVTQRSDGGSEVVHQIAMKDGGKIPKWLVDLVRTRGFAKIMADVREVAAPGG